MFRTLIDAFKMKDIRKKILLTLVLLIIYRLGCFIPIPGIGDGALKTAVEGETSGFLGLLSSISGGALSNGAFFALGVSPYITATIIVQLLSAAFPALERLSKEGEEGRKKLALYNRIAALILAVAQATGIVVAFGTSGSVNIGLPTWLACVIMALVLVAGAMMTVWIGERITELGIGNGLSLLIFVGILSSAGLSIAEAVINITDIDYVWNLLIFVAAVVVIFALIVFVDGAERRIPVQYAKQVKGRRMMQGQSTFLPIRVSGAGVMPIIFASTLLIFPQLLISIFDSDMSSGFSYWWSRNVGAGSWLYIVLTAVLIFLFSFFWSQLTFNPEDVSKQIQQNGGFIQGYRPGPKTAEYLAKVSRRITLFGAFFLAFIALVPSLAFKAISSNNTSLVNAFSATGLMIVVSVALELDKQLKSQMTMRNYRGFLK